MQRPREITRLLWGHLGIVPVRLGSVRQHVRKPHHGQQVPLKAKSGILIYQPPPDSEAQTCWVELRETFQGKWVNPAHWWRLPMKFAQSRSLGFWIAHSFDRMKRRPGWVGKQASLWIVIPPSEDERAHQHKQGSQAKESAPCSRPRMRAKQYMDS